MPLQTHVRASRSGGRAGGQEARAMQGGEDGRWIGRGGGIERNARVWCEESGQGDRVGRGMTEEGDGR
eukprot:1674451-Rhodomonas_salina.1